MGEGGWRWQPLSGDSFLQVALPVLKNTLGADAIDAVMDQHCPGTKVSIRDRHGVKTLSIYGSDVAAAFDDIMEHLLRVDETLLGNIMFKASVTIGLEPTCFSSSGLEACPQHLMDWMMRPMMQPSAACSGAFPQHLVHICRQATGRIDTRNLQHIDIPGLIDDLVMKVNAIPEDVNGMTGIRLALCSTTLCRNFQTLVALPTVLLACWPYRRLVRVFVADFNKDSTLFDFVGHHLHEALDAGLLKYRWSHSLKYWDASRAKNAIHFEAIRCGAKAVMNLDTDRVIPHGFLAAVLRAFHLGSDVVDASNTVAKGSTGTVGGTADVFTRVNGYDESFKPSGGQDIDVLLRMERSSSKRRYRLRDLSLIGGTLSNAQEGMADTTKIKVENVEPSRWEKWGKMNQDNIAQMRANLEEGRFKANTSDDAWAPLPLMMCEFHHGRDFSSGGEWELGLKCDRNPQRIMIFTCGWRKMPQDFPAAGDAWRQSGQLRGTSQLSKWQEALHASGFPVHLVLTATAFRQRSPHLGFHVDALRDFMSEDHVEGRASMYHSVKSMLGHWSDAPPCLAIAIVCETGCSASVAAAIVLRYVIHLDQQWQLPVELTHLSSFHWRVVICQLRARLEGRSGCDMCKSLTQMDAPRRAVLQQALLEFQTYPMPPSAPGGSGSGSGGMTPPRQQLARGSGAGSSGGGGTSGGVTPHAYQQLVRGSGAGSSGGASGNRAPPPPPPPTPPPPPPLEPLVERVE